jgi:translation initiation factor 2 alpha subunit (eIF-2alpha)
MQLKIADIVLCTVKSIEGTSVFLDIDNYGTGSMIMSEVAAGRIRNIREYVIPNKKVVCKVLSIDKDNIQLSLRRVTGKEREQALENYKKERNLISIFKTFLKNPEEKIKEIKEESNILDFIEEARKNKKTLEKFFTKSEVEKLIPLLEEKETKEKEVKKIFSLKSLSSNGIDKIKSILIQESKKAEIKYLGSSQFSIKVKGIDFKEANNSINAILDKININSKSKKIIFEAK